MLLEVALIAFSVFGFALVLSYPFYNSRKLQRKLGETKERLTKLFGAAEYCISNEVVYFLRPFGVRAIGNNDIESSNAHHHGNLALDAVFITVDAEARRKQRDGWEL